MIQHIRFPVALAVLIGAAAGADLQAQDKSKSDKPGSQLAHIRLAGSMDEAPVAVDPLFGSSSENFKAKLDRIARASKDANVAGLYVQLDNLQLGWAKLEELRGALEAFRKTGKKVYAYIEGGDAQDYLLAAAADKVGIAPSDAIMIVGMRAEIMFFKELLEKLGIRADFLQMGIFKFAAEPYTRSKMSDAAKSQYKLVLDDFFDTCYVGSISRSRLAAGQKQMTPQHVAKLIDHGLFTAAKAKEAGLVDHVAYASEFEDWMKSDLQKPDIKLARDYGKEKSKDLDLSNPFNIFKLLSPPKATADGKKDRIALIYAVGAIVTGKGSKSLFGGDTVGSTTMIEAIREAEKDPKVRAIVLRVDSPGGSALASDLIWRELKNCKKPVIASMSDVAASGGYYISMGARKVYAQPGTLTGSIGVVSGKLALGGLFDKVGITTDVISRGANAGMLSPTEVFSKSERQAMEGMMAEIYEQFLTKVLENRAAAGHKFTKKDLLKLAEGRIWTGRQAHEKGLVDALGSLTDAIAEAKTMGGLAPDADVDYLVLPKPRSFLDALLEREGSPLFSMKELGLTRSLPELTDHLAAVEGLLQLRHERVWLMMPHGLRVR